MNELLEILKSLSQETELDFERSEMLYNVVSESPARFLRLLVQKNSRISTAPPFQIFS